MLYWKFYISNIEVEEPQGWDGVEFVLKRSQNFIGLENIFTPTALTFDSVGANLIQNEFEREGFNGSLPIRIEQLCDNVIIGSFNWSLNLFTYKKVNNEVTVQAEETNFQSKFKNRSSIKVSLEDIKTQGGATIPSILPTELKLHSKAIDYLDTAKLDEFSKYQDYGIFQLQPNRQLTVHIPQEVVVSELNGIIPMFDYMYLRDQSSPLDGGALPFFVAPFASTFTFEYDFEVNVYFYDYQGSLTMNWASVFWVDGVAIVDPNHTIQAELYLSNGEKRITRSKGQVTFNLNKGSSVAMAISFFNINNNIDYQVHIIRESVRFELSVKTSSLFLPSTAKTYPIFTAFSRIVSLITDTQFSFKSDFFSQPNIFPYNDAGCGGYTNITNGKNIRNMVQKDGSRYSIAVSFDELFQSADAVWCLGYRIEYDGYGRGSIRIEPRSYFFKNQSTEILENVSDIEYSVAHDKIFNEITIGYEKWNLNTGRVNGIDEFNTVHNYSLPLVNAKNKINAVSKAIASGYVIEITRRIQYNDNPTSDFETDDDIFFISTNPFEVTSDKYTLDKSTATYPSGTVSERDENFTAVANLLSPSTAYNLRLSPKRNLARWWGYVASSLFWKIKANPLTEIKFNSGQGNILESDLMSGYCDDFGGLVCSQANGLKQSDLFNGTLLFVPTLAKFEYPITMNVFGIIRNQSDKTLQFTCGLNAKSGYVEEINFKPNSENGTSDITLLLSPDNLGAFDSGFDSGFDI